MSQELEQVAAALVVDGKGILAADETVGTLNAYELGRYAALCQEQRLVPIMEPEVLMEGAPGVVFPSGGQSDRPATAHLKGIYPLGAGSPWRISFSDGRALQDPALEAWNGHDENVKVAQEALEAALVPTGRAGQWEDD